MKEKSKKNYPVVFDYIDYREFLKDYYECRSAAEKKFTKTYLCACMGLPNSRSYFSDVVSGRRNISTGKVVLLLSALNLGREQSEYFKYLVLYNQTDLPDEKEVYFNQLIALNQAPKKFVTKDEYKFYSQWYHAIIRAILDIKDFSDNYSALSRLIIPSVSPSEVKMSIQLMNRLKFIKRNERGFWKPTSKNITSGNAARDELIRKYQLNCLKLSEKYLTELSYIKQYLYTKTISVSETGYKRIRQKIKKFSSEVSSIIHNDDNKADSIYHINFHIFHHLKESKRS